MKEIKKYWNKRAKIYSSDCEKVEQSKRTQIMRYEAFLINNSLENKSILDVGCGTGDFYDYIKTKKIDCDYKGVDISDEMIKRAKERFPLINFEEIDILNMSSSNKFDYVISVGIHNIHADNIEKLIKEYTLKQFNLSNICAHVSILTDRFKGFAPHIKAWRAEAILEMALDITPYVILRHDYLPNDFCVSLYHEPLIDKINI